MIKIETGKNFKIENLLSLRKKMSQKQVNEEIVKIQQFLKENGIRKDGPLINATYGVEVINGEQILDMEFLIPLDREVNLPKEYKFKKVLYLANSVYARHTGNPATLQNTYAQINKYVKDNNLQPLAPLYNINVKEANSPLEINDMIIDVYLPVNPCIL
ncbi:DUF5085 family protein [Tepidibacter thalassicus]|uniref:Effector-binding domain-containing protein n=1 Tax=Tepidibacter thalassicus DSM 15285 TaxID=1123350 RepID=A0A1M5QVV6_9FIRM|nr:DUF5085 family protein [Tepidibacter thalassicus]SHH17673.1 protein of unknown function [Tepidibacter thalassicus DSM 15285]